MGIWLLTRGLNKFDLQVVRGDGEAFFKFLLKAPKVEKNETSRDDNHVQRFDKSNQLLV